MRIIALAAAWVGLLTTAASATGSWAKNATAAEKVGQLVREDVETELQREIQSVVDEFEGVVPHEVRHMVVTALNLHRLQKESGEDDATESLDSLKTAVLDKLAAIQAEVVQGFASNETLHGVDLSRGDQRVGELRACLAEVISKEGQTGGATCLSRAGSVAAQDLKQVFENTISQFDFHLPINAVLAMQRKINDYLSHSDMIPEVDRFIRDTEASMLSVVAATTGDYVEAVYYAEACFFQAMSQPTYDQAMEHACNVNDTDSSTLNSVENIYRDTVNQYSSILPASVVRDVQAIGTAKLRGQLNATEAQVRNDVNDAILSVAASYGGNTASLTYELLKCLNLVLVPGAGDEAAELACLRSDTGPSALVLNRIKGYIEQFYGVLPPRLVLDLENSLLPRLQTDAPDSVQDVKTELDEMFKASGAGPEYVTCFEGYANCTLDALTSLSASSVCTPDDYCANVPFQSAVVDPTSPYQDAVKKIYQIGRVRWQAMQARKQANQARARRLRKRSFDDSMPKSSRLIKHRMMVSRPGSQHD